MFRYVESLYLTTGEPSDQQHAPYSLGERYAKLRGTFRRGQTERLNRFFPNIVAASLIFIAVACADDSISAPSERSESQNYTVQPEGPVGQGSNLHRRRPSQIDSVIKDFTLDSTTVSFGTLFYWKNLDDVTHRVMSGTPDAPTGLWDSGDLREGDTFKVEFLFQGRFDYFCSIHPYMRGSLRVVGATNNYEENGFHM